MSAVFKTAALALIALASIALVSACQDAEAEGPLRIGMIPDAGGGSASVIEKQPLAEYLAAATGREIELIIPTSYNATVEALGNGTLDIAYLGGLTFVKAHERYGAKPLVQREIDQAFHSVFITRPDSGIRALTDLPGRSFCFGDINSTSGHLMPRLAMANANVPAEQLGRFRYTGSHPATAQGVASDACEAGAMDQTVYDSLVETGQIDPAMVEVFHVTEPFADYVWAAREKLDPKASEDFSRAMMALERGTHDQVLDILRGDAFVPAKTQYYDGVAQTARDLGLL